VGKLINVIQFRGVIEVLLMSEEVIDETYNFRKPIAYLLDTDMIQHRYVNTKKI